MFTQVNKGENPAPRICFNPTGENHGAMFHLWVKPTDLSSLKCASNFSRINSGRCLISAYHWCASEASMNHGRGRRQEFSRDHQQDCLGSDLFHWFLNGRTNDSRDPRIPLVSKPTPLGWNQRFRIENSLKFKFWRDYHVHQINYSSSKPLQENLKVINLFLWNLNNNPWSGSAHS